MDEQTFEQLLDNFREAVRLDTIHKNCNETIRIDDEHRLGFARAAVLAAFEEMRKENERLKARENVALEFCNKFIMNLAARHFEMSLSERDIYLWAEAFAFIAQRSER